uniref:ATP synthase F0 subunit 6 n=1 Tax=Teratoscincus przewalskii TaxID=52169 RepID=UPI002206A615|nr:ATP synthase F0 subunit 6 [Teratoscincus przewalskii]UXP34300.1 ATP synthase F0 subunit 6 [Teratoscincus przewalskii]
MMLNFFDQFMTPELLGIPLMLIAMLLPAIILYPSSRLLPNRTSATKMWLMNNFIKQLMAPLNKTGHNWAAIMLMVMYYLLMINLLGLLPYTFTPTTQLSLNMSLAVPLWLSTVLTGLRSQPTISLSHLLPTGTPTPLIPILIIIETISLFIRPLALGVRLTANLTAGHLLMQLISTATLVLAPLMPTLSILTGMLLLLLTGLEIAVAMIQAYVFVLLLSLYLQENT